jgi:hypothetical protein
LSPAGGSVPFIGGHAFTLLKKSNETPTAYSTELYAETLAEETTSLAKKKP